VNAFKDQWSADGVPLRIHKASISQRVLRQILEDSVKEFVWKLRLHLD
jgi:hypothetical protein